MKKLVNRLKRLSDRTRGAILTVALTLAVLVYFFGPVLANPNKYYFDRTGDGLLTYYYASYQLKYDSTYWHIGASNYPYGESVFFSSDQPVLTAALRFVNNNLLSVDDYIPGIFNSVMLYSFCLCALFIYLILYDTGANKYYAALFAIGITFLSPQWTRIQAHFPLSYAFAIPGLIYLLLRFSKAPSLKKSLGIAVFVFIMACLHAYFIGLFGVIFAVYFLFHAFRKKEFFKNLLRHFLYVFVQLVLPFVLLQLMINVTSSVTDRPQYPWGFLHYVSSFDGMFFPYGKPYQETFSSFNAPDEIIQYEGISYIGLFAMLMLLVFLLRKGGELTHLQFRDFAFSGLRTEMSMLLVVGLLGALYACAFPYTWYPELMYHVGPLRQMRGLGRFAWLFFYTINIFAAWFYFRLVARAPRLWAKLLLCALPLYMLYYDAYYNVRPVSEGIRNEMPLLSDKLNALPENQWVKDFDASEYQAIIPMPYFLLGSENIQVEAENREIVRQAYVVSLKTGLPLTGGVLSRTSLSQTAKNLGLITEAYRPLEIVKDFHSKKPLLILAREGDITSPMQRELLYFATQVKQTSGFNMYRLPYERLATYSDSLYAHITKEAAGQQLHDVEGWRSTQPAKNFYYGSFDAHACATPYRGAGAYQGYIKEWNRLYEDTIPNAQDNHTYVMSFWIKDFTKDQISLSTIETAYVDSASGVAYGGWWGVLAGHYRALDSTWGLIEIYIKPQKRHDKLTVTVWNNHIIDSTRLVVDEFWIRPEGTNIYKELPGEVFKNNRYYLEKK